MGNPYNLDMGKLIVPYVYIDVELLKEVAANYDPVIRMIRTFDRIKMVRVTKEEMVEVFKLTEWSEDMVKIDEKELMVE